jgi:hypothetical protein
VLDGSIKQAMFIFKYVLSVSRNVTRIDWFISFRIGMHSVCYDLSSTIQQPIGFTYKVVSKMDGHPFNLNVYLTHVIRWMFRLK